MKILFLFISMFTQVALAQTLGNPGGGGPDDEMRNQTNLCKTHLITLKELETNYLSLRNKKFLGFEQFNNQINEIKNEIIIDNITNILKITELQTHVCVDENQEVKAIQEILIELEGSIAKECHANSELRITHINALKSLLDLYGKK